MTKARLEEVIIVESNRGLGRDEKDPVRTVTSIFRKDGKLIAEVDPLQSNEGGKYCIEDYVQVNELKKQLINACPVIPFPEQ